MLSLSRPCFGFALVSSCALPAAVLIGACSSGDGGGSGGSAGTGGDGSAGTGAAAGAGQGGGSGGAATGGSGNAGTTGGNGAGGSAGSGGSGATGGSSAGSGGAGGGGTGGGDAGGGGAGGAGGSGGGSGDGGVGSMPVTVSIDLTSDLDVTLAVSGAATETCVPGAACSVTIDPGATVTLAITGIPPYAAAAFTGCTPTTAPTCTVTPTADVSVTADVEPFGNLVFITAARYDGALGGHTGASAKCQAAADAEGLPGTYRALLHDGSTATDLSTASGPLAQGFIRTDGAYMARTTDQLLSGDLNRLPLDEAGTYVFHRPFWLNLDNAGNPLSDHCNGFQSNADTFDGDVQYSSTVNRSAATQLGCEQTPGGSLLCVGVNGVYDLSAPGLDKVNDYVFFLSEGTWTPWANGRAAADLLCSGEATGAGLSGTYGAYLSIEDELAGTRINASQTYVRGDGTPFIDTAHLVAGTTPTGPTIPINVHADGTTELGDVNAWTGSTTSHCSSFTSTSGFGQRGRANRPDMWFDNTSATCTTPLHLYCFRR